MDVPGIDGGRETDCNSLIEELRQHEFELQQQNEELRRTYAELNSATARFRELWTDAPVGYLTLERSGLITVANRRAIQLLSQVQPLRDGMSIQAFLADQSKSVFLQHFWTVADSAVPPVAELQLRTSADAPECWVRIESTCNQHGEFRSALIDISAQKAAEACQLALSRQLQQSQKMEVLHELSAGIAHDFNNILQIVMGYAEIARAQIFRADLDTQHIDALTHGAQRGVALTRRLLAFSRKSSLQAKAVDLRTVVSNTIALARRTVGENVLIESKLAQDSLPVCVDSNLVEQALLNLCVNARDAMPEGGNLLIGVARRGIPDTVMDDGTQLITGPYAVITVADSGHGIAPSVREKIFEPFYTTKEVGAGTGLGLAIVYGIVTQHDGGIRVNSTPGQGTVFELFLPLSSDLPASATAPPSQADALGVHGSGTILLAEDESKIRDLVSTFLSNAGYNVLTAPDGAQAQRLIDDAGDTIDLLLTDAVMPGKSGKDVCDYFHQRSPSAPVIFLTGHGEDVVDRCFLDRHQATLLSKPIQLHDLLEAVTRRLNERIPTSNTGTQARGFRELPL